jgi:hypothetical protein
MTTTGFLDYLISLHLMYNIKINYFAALSVHSFFQRKDAAGFVHRSDSGLVFLPLTSVVSQVCLLSSLFDVDSTGLIRLSSKLLKF